MALALLREPLGSRARPLPLPPGGGSVRGLLRDCARRLVRGGQRAPAAPGAGFRAPCLSGEVPSNPSDSSLAAYFAGLFRFFNRSCDKIVFVCLFFSVFPKKVCT